MKQAAGIEGRLAQLERLLHPNAPDQAAEAARAKALAAAQTSYLALGDRRATRQQAALAAMDKLDAAVAAARTAATALSAVVELDRLDFNAQADAAKLGLSEPAPPRLAAPDAWHLEAFHDDLSRTAEQARRAFADWPGTRERIRKTP